MRDQYIVMNVDDGFDPARFGIRPLAVTAVVCRGRTFFAVYGDTNPYRQSATLSDRLALT